MSLRWKRHGVMRSQLRADRRAAPRGCSLWDGDQEVISVQAQYGLGGGLVQGNALYWYWYLVGGPARPANTLPTKKAAKASALAYYESRFWPR